jgi:hypothetical protein
MDEMHKCFICGCCDESVSVLSGHEVKTKFDCPICGVYRIDLGYYPDADRLIIGAVDELSGCHSGGYSIKLDRVVKFDALYEKKTELKALLKYYVKKYNPTSIGKHLFNSSDILIVDYKWCSRIFGNHFPNPKEQVNYLITFLGDEQSRTHKLFNYAENLGQLNLISATASIDYGNVARIIEHAKELDFVKSANDSLNLTIKGWGEYARQTHEKNISTRLTICHKQIS